MRISDLARESGVSVETVRFYVQKGLIARPLRPKGGGYREYPAEAVRRISFLRSAQSLGFSLNEIAELLALEAGDNARCADVRQRAEHKREEVLHKIDNLKRIEKALNLLIEACPGEGPARTCSILEAIHTGDLRLSAIARGETNDRQTTPD